MDKPMDHYWQLRLADLKKALEANNFDVFIARDKTEAKEIVLKDILPGSGVKSVSRGGSMTFMATGLYEEIKNNPNLEIIEPWEKNISPGEKKERMRQALLVDLYLTGTNAVTETGELVNLDMIGNRIGGITFGPKNVIILVGRNKIVPDLEDAINRIKNYVAPVNAMRLDKKTPCVKTSICQECKSRDRICNTWLITQKSFPKGRAKIVLINEDLGI